MTFKFRSIAAAAVLAAFLMAPAGCDNASNNSTTASSNGATATTASDAAPMTTTGSAGAMPTQCQDYLNSVQACLDHVSAQNPAAVAQVRETLDVNRDAIVRLSHEGSPLEYCVSANNAWESRKGNFGC
jgi:hypothetical protein